MYKKCLNVCKARIYIFYLKYMHNGAKIHTWKKKKDSLYAFLKAS
jgi:hypothetical protein